MAVVEGGNSLGRRVVCVTEARRVARIHGYRSFNARVRHWGNVVVFSVLYGLVLRPLDVPQPKNLFQVIHGKCAAQSYRDYVDYRDRDPSFSGMMAYQTERVGMTVDTSASRSWGFATSGNYFDVLGIEPALGRSFMPVMNMDLHLLLSSC